MFDPKWRSRDGRAYDISDMDTSHIENSIARIVRMKNWRTEYLGRLEAELMARAMGLTTKRTT